YAICKSWRAVYAKRAFLVQEGPQQNVKAYQVIDVGMRNIDLADFKDVPGCEVVQIAAIEKQGFTARGQADIQTGVAERIVNKSGVKDGSHVYFLPNSGTLQLEFRRPCLNSQSSCALFLPARTMP